jgi:hypothetical protein
MKTKSIPPSQNTSIPNTKDGFSSSTADSGLKCLPAPPGTHFPHTEGDHGDEIRHVKNDTPSAVVRPIDFRNDQKTGKPDAPRGDRRKEDTPGGIPGEELPPFEDGTTPVPATESA